jgi:hypothetical protein
MYSKQSLQGKNKRRKQSAANSHEADPLARCLCRVIKTGVIAVNEHF